MIQAVPIIEIFVLWFTSRYVFQGIYNCLVRIGLPRRAAIHILSFLFLPGTIVHELAHLLTAEGLGVRTGHFTVFPQEHEGHIKMGSVMVARTDPVRSFFIGIAPLLLGIGSISGIFFGIGIVHSGSLPEMYKVLVYIFSGYLFFVIVNTMFSSKKDLEACIEFFGLLIILLLVFLIWGEQYWIYVLKFFQNDGVLQGLAMLGRILFVPVGINLGVLVLGRGVQKVMS